MPLRKSASSLEELCLDVVVSKFDCLQYRLANQPSAFISKILDRLCPKHYSLAPGTYRPFLSNVFVHPGTKTLRGLQMFDLPLHSLLDKIGQVCKNLLDLDLSDCVEISSGSLIDLLQRLPRIQRLNFSDSAECTDQIVAEISQNCPVLMYLDMFGCINVTDVGLSCLINCKKLQFLCVARTGVTPTGCLRSLNQLPHLKTFQHDFDTELFELLKQQFNLDKSSLPTYSLEDTRTYGESNQEDAIIQTTIFPNLLNLSIRDARSLDFNIVLKQAHRLTSLQLISVRLVDLKLVNRYCPVLKILGLKRCSVFNETKTGSLKVLFENLLVLCIDMDGEEAITEMELKMLVLQCRNIKSLIFTSCRTVSDNFISELVELKALENLTDLHFIMCHSITLRSVMKLIELQNPLKRVSCITCNNIESSDAGEIEAHIKSKNLDCTVMIF